VIAFAITASGLKYVGVDTTTLGWLLCAILLGGGSLWLITAQPWREVDMQAPPLSSEADALEVEEALAGAGGGGEAERPAHTNAAPTHTRGSPSRG
jgi:hypothetical protein